MTAFLFVALGLEGRAQAPVQVTPCDLVKSPQKYAGKVVEVRARVNLAFEDFSLAQDGCEDVYPPVWLAYGGDVPTPTASTVNDLARKPGSVLRVNGVPVPLVHDTALELFKQRLSAHRFAAIADRQCYDCYLFKVTATLRGLFFAGNTGKGFAGYGHLGCCHLLAIEQVSDVAAERALIPLGGTFSCSKEVRKLTDVEAQRVHTTDQPCGNLSFRRCWELRSRQVAAVAASWDDPIRADEWHSESGMIEGHRLTRGWESADKLKVYTLQIDFDGDPTKAESKATGGTITRETCSAVVQPLPMTASPSCRDFWTEFPISRADQEQVRKNVEAGRDAWRLGSEKTASGEALKEAAARWNVVLAPDLQLEDCDQPMEYEKDQFAWCHWSDPEGMQTFSVQVTRFGSIRHGRQWQAVPWQLTRGNGTACTIVP